MQTTTGISMLQMTVSENPAVSAGGESLAAVMRKARHTDWDAVIVKADRLISRAGAAFLAVSAFYFAAIFVLKMLK